MFIRFSYLQGGFRLQVSTSRVKYWTRIENQTICDDINHARRPTSSNLNFIEHRKTFDFYQMNVEKQLSSVKLCTHAVTYRNWSGKKNAF